MDVGNDRVRRLESGDPQQLGSHVVLGRLGSGGMGTVFLARTAEWQLVAIKLIHRQLSDEPRVRQRLHSEVERAHLVPAFCTARVIGADTEHDPPYIISDYIDAPSLAENVEKFGPLPQDDVYAVAVGVASALTAIHGAAVIHRDLKPRHVLLAADGAKVIDFGIGLAFEQTGKYTGIGAGAYTAPEHFGTDPGLLTPAADIFEWGAVVAYAATGHAGPEFANLEGITEPLRGLVKWALEPKPEDRPTARYLVDVLVGGGMAVTATHPVPVAGPNALAARIGGLDGDGVARTAVNGHTTTLAGTDTEPAAAPPGADVAPTVVGARSAAATGGAAPAPFSGGAAPAAFAGGTAPAALAGGTAPAALAGVVGSPPVSSPPLGRISGPQSAWHPPQSLSHPPGRPTSLADSAPPSGAVPVPASGNARPIPGIAFGDPDAAGATPSRLLKGSSPEPGDSAPAHASAPAETAPKPKGRFSKLGRAKKATPDAVAKAASSPVTTAEPPPKKSVPPAAASEPTETQPARGLRKRSPLVISALLLIMLSVVAGGAALLHRWQDTTHTSGTPAPTTPAAEPFIPPIVPSAVPSASGVPSPSLSASPSATRTTSPRPTPSASRPPIAAKPQNIKSGLNAKCLTSSGPAAVMAACSRSTTWRFTKEGTIKRGTQCLEATANGTADGTAVAVAACKSTIKGQRWQLTGGALQNTNAKKCLDIRDGNLADGAPVQLWTCVGTPNQRWSLA